MTNPQQKVWLVTGCSSGLGLALATRLIRETQHQIVMTALDRNDLLPLLQEAPDRARALDLDITRPEDVAAAVDFTLDAFGRIDILVNNAGVGQIGAIEELNDAEINRVMGINFFGTLNMLRAVIPVMRKQRGGRILTLTSMGGFRGRPAVGIYNASKFALEGLHEALAGELAPFGVETTMIEPGLFRSGFRGGTMQLAQTVIDDYADTSGKVRAAVSLPYPDTAAYPEQIAAGIIALGEMAEHLPLRLQLGRDATAATREKLDFMTGETTRWEAVAAEASAADDVGIDSFRRLIAEAAAQG